MNSVFDGSQSKPNNLAANFVLPAIGEMPAFDDYLRELCDDAKMDWTVGQRGWMRLLEDDSRDGGITVFQDLAVKGSMKLMELLWKVVDERRSLPIQVSIGEDGFRWDPDRAPESVPEAASAIRRHNSGNSETSMGSGQTLVENNVGIFTNPSEATTSVDVRGSARRQAVAAKLADGFRNGFEFEGEQYPGNPDLTDAEIVVRTMQAKEILRYMGPASMNVPDILFCDYAVHNPAPSSEFESWNGDVSVRSRPNLNAAPLPSEKKKRKKNKRKKKSASIAASEKDRIQALLQTKEVIDFFHAVEEHLAEEEGPVILDSFVRTAPKEVAELVSLHGTLADVLKLAGDDFPFRVGMDGTSVSVPPPPKAPSPLAENVGDDSVSDSAAGKRLRMDEQMAELNVLLQQLGHQRDLAMELEDRNRTALREANAKIEDLEKQLRMQKDENCVMRASEKNVSDKLRKEVKFHKADAERTKSEAKTRMLELASARAEAVEELGTQRERAKAAEVAFLTFKLNTFTANYSAHITCADSTLQDALAIIHEFHTAMEEGRRGPHLEAQRQKWEDYRHQLQNIIETMRESVSSFDLQQREQIRQIKEDGVELRHLPPIRAAKEPPPPTCPPPPQFGAPPPPATPLQVIKGDQDGLRSARNDTLQPREQCDTSQSDSPEERKTFGDTHQEFEDESPSPSPLLPEQPTYTYPVMPTFTYPPGLEPSPPMSEDNPGSSNAVFVPPVDDASAHATASTSSASAIARLGKVFDLILTGFPDLPGYRPSHLGPDEIQLRIRNSVSKIRHNRIAEGHVGFCGLKKEQIARLCLEWLHAEASAVAPHAADAAHYASRGRRALSRVPAPALRPGEPPSSARPAVVPESEEVDASGQEENECAICLELLVPSVDSGRKLIACPCCERAFHEHCLNSWLMNGRKTCPLCQQHIVLDSEFPALSHPTRRLSATQQARQ